MPLITDLPNIVANLPSYKRARFERLMRLDASQGECVIPDSMREWTLKHFGSIEAVQHQNILRITNVWTWEGAVYNPIRGMRPVEMTTRLRSRNDRRPTMVPQSSVVGRPSSPPSPPPEDVFAEPLKTTAADVFGRVQGQYCISTGNIARWEGQHAVLIFNEFDPLKFTRAHLRDYFRTSLEWAQLAHAQEPRARYFIWTWNGGVKGGASIPHAHAQMALAQGMHYGRIEQLRHAAVAYRAQHGSNYFEDIVAAHADVGLAFEVAGLPALAYLPALRAKDTWVIGRAFDEQLADGLCDVLRVLIDQANMGAFNVAVLMPPLFADASVADYGADEDWSDFPVIARIVDRGSPAMLSSDIGALDIFAHQVNPVDPFGLVEILRPACADGKVSQTSS